MTVNYQTNNVPTLTVNGTLSVSGLLTLGFSTLSGSGSVTADGGMVISGVGPTLDGITINNVAGQTATCSSTRSLPTYDGTTFNNLGTFISTSNSGFSDEDPALLRCSTTRGALSTRATPRATRSRQPRLTLTAALSMCRAAHLTFWVEARSPARR